MLLAVLAAEQSSEVRRVIESTFAGEPAQLTSSTPAMDGNGEVFFTNTYASVRICAAEECQRDDLLSIGTKITAHKYVKGQRISGSTRWIAFLHHDKLRYIHDSMLSRTWPVVEPTSALTNSRNTGLGSASPTPKIPGRDDVFFAKTQSRVRYCANLNCRTDAILSSGTRITARRYVSGQQVNGSARWIAFRHQGEIRYIHDSELSRTWPPHEPSPTAEPTRVKATAVGQGEIFYAKSGAYARYCSRLTCQVYDVVPAGTKITALRFIQGESIDGNDLWIRFSYNRRHLSIHSGSLTRIAPTEQPTRVKATAVGQGEIFYAKSGAYARYCSRLTCQVYDVVPAGTKITALRFIQGELIDGNDLWIRFSYNRRHLSIHSGGLTRRAPTDARSPTGQRPDTNSVASDSSREYYLKIRARARTCPRQDCDVAATLPKGTRIAASGYISGQAVNGSDRWVSFDYNRGNAYIRMSLLSRRRTSDAPEAQPSSTTRPARRNPSSVADSTPLYVSERATVYKCVSTSCLAIDTLERGVKIYPSGQWYGQRINGSNSWYRLRHQDQTVYIHSSYVSEHEPVFERSTDSSSAEALRSTSAQPVRFENNRNYYVRSHAIASVRRCANTRCDVIGVLPPGMRVRALRVVHGESINLNDIWIKFNYTDGYRYVHSRHLSPRHVQVDPNVEASPSALSSTTEAPSPTEAPPTAVSIATQPPASEAPRTAPTTAVAVTYLVETAGNANAHIRACPRTSCDIVAKYAPGTEVEVIGKVAGETVYGTDIWFEINFDGGSAYIHSELAARAG